MRVYEIEHKEIGKVFEHWDLIDYEQGCLLDNYIFQSSSHIAFIFEEYLNEWSSGNVIYIIPLRHKNVIRKMEERFESLRGE